MNAINRFLAIVFIAFGILSCQKSEVEVVPEKIVYEDKILIGKWMGTLRQPGYLPVLVDAIISKLEINKKAGNITGQDYCSTDLTYIDKISVTFLFKEDLVPGLNVNCIGGNSAIYIISKDTLNYQWVGEDNPRNIATAILVRK